MKLHRSVGWAVSAWALGACSLGQNPADPQMQGGQTGDEFDKLFQKVEGEAPREPSDGSHASDAADELAVFAWSFYEQTAPADQSFVYSPYSIATAAAMLYAGAAGQTRSEMQDVFAFSDEGDAFHRARNDLIRTLEQRNIAGDDDHNAQVLQVANDFWMAERLQPTDRFLNVLSAYYGAPVFLFGQGSDEVRSAINGKIADETMGLIPDLLPSGSVDADTIFVLTNALYFKANWFTPFFEDLTAPADFKLLSGDTTQVDMMHVTEEGFFYGQDSGTQVVVMPYWNGDIDFVVFCPKSGSFETFRADLNPERVATLLDGVEDTALDLSFPKMTVESRLPLRTALIQAGMVSAFEPDADFSRLAQNQLWLDNAFHKAKMILDEKGTEAAAATALTARDISLGGPEAVAVTIDRPFVFLIRDRATGAVLFLGHYVGPE